MRDNVRLASSLRRMRYFTQLLLVVLVLTFSVPLYGAYYQYRIVPLIRYTPHIKDIPYKKSGRPTQKNRGPRRRSTVLSHGLSS